MSVLVSDRSESKFEAITYSIELHNMLIELMQRSFEVPGAQTSTHHPSGLPVRIPYFHKQLRFLHRHIFTQSTKHNFPYLHCVHS